MDAQARQATADALRRIENDGSDLSKPLEIDFFIAAPSQEAGQAIAEAASKLGFLTQLELDEESQDYTCYCTTKIIPSTDRVVEIEESLHAIGQQFGGHGDGFGSFGNAG